MNRTIDTYLLAWKTDTKRKPLVIRGARQVGKTYSVRQLGATFSYFIEVNFEKDHRLASLFTGALEPKPLCEKLTFYRP